MKTIEAIKGNEEIILDHYGLFITKNKHIDCGICRGKKKLRINIFNGTLAYICTCGSGTIFKYLEESIGLTFKAVAADIDRLLGNTFKTEVLPESEDVTSKVMRKFKSLPLLKGTKGGLYLNNRGIYHFPVNGIRYNPREGEYQSLYAIATDDNYRPVYLHRTLLSGEKKANIEVNKKMFSLKSSQGSVSIKLFPVQSTLGIAEGIETALSCTQIYKCATWSTLNSSLMKRFKAPTGVEHLIIFADNDKKGAGHAAAFECANKNMLANNNVVKVSVRWTAELGDFNNMLNEGSEVFEWIFLA